MTFGQIEVESNQVGVESNLEDKNNLEVKTNLNVRTNTIKDATIKEDTTKEANVREEQLRLLGRSISQE